MREENIYSPPDDDLGMMRMADLRKLEPDDYLPDPRDTSSPKDRTKEIKSRLIHLRAIGPVLRTAYLAKGWLSAGGYSITYGPSNAGKTFVVLDLAMHIAAGEEWRGCKVNGGPVFYIAAEGGYGVFNRLAAFKIERPHMANADFTLLPIGVNLHASGDAAIIISLLEGTNPALIVVDTLARVMGEGDESTAKDAGMFIRNCDLIREATGAHVMVIHHTGKDEDRGGRGSSAYRAACDTEIFVSSNHTITCKKQRDMVEADDLHFSLRTVTLGADQDGDPVTSAVIEPADKPPPSRKPLTGRHQVAMTALMEALDKYGAVQSGSDYPDGCPAVAVEHWRDACAAHRLTTGSSESAARTAFKRAKDKLLDWDEVREFGGYVWRVRDDANPSQTTHARHGASHVRSSLTATNVTHL